jgi:putative phage-type endonuclease
MTGYPCGLIHDGVEQGTPEWHALRAGKVTASRIADVMATIKSGEAASRRNYRAELVCQRLTGTVQQGFVSSEMQWGTDHEEDACKEYAFPRDVDPVKVGFVDHPTVAMGGASPDRLVGDHGLVEIKCPNTATHIETLLGKSVPGKYVHQIQWQLACTGRLWCDFVSYDPRLPYHLRLFVARVMRNDIAIAAITAEVTKFLAEVDDTVAALNALQEAA